MLDSPANTPTQITTVPQIDLIPLQEGNTAELVALLNNPAVIAHMPLATAVTGEWVEDWKRAKSKQWPDPNMGPWVVHIDRRFAGWAGVQPDSDTEVELAIVLDAWAWGYGRGVASAALARWREFGDPRPVVVYLPYSRPIRAMQDRWGWRFLGDTDFSGTKFAKLAIPDSFS